MHEEKSSAGDQCNLKHKPIRRNKVGNRKKKISVRGPGRPPLWENSTHIKFLVPVDLVNRVRGLAEKNGVSMADEFRDLINRGLSRT